MHQQLTELTSRSLAAETYGIATPLYALLQDGIEQHRITLVEAIGIARAVRYCAGTISNGDRALQQFVGDAFRRALLSALANETDAVQDREQDYGRIPEAERERTRCVDAGLLAGAVSADMPGRWGQC